METDVGQIIWVSILICSARFSDAHLSAKNLSRTNHEQSHRNSPDRVRNFLTRSLSGLARLAAWNLRPPFAFQSRQGFN